MTERDVCFECAGCGRCAPDGDCADFAGCEAWRGWFAVRWGETRALFSATSANAELDEFGRAKLCATSANAELNEFGGAKLCAENGGGCGVSERILRLKEQDGRSWRTLAELCGMTERSIFRYANGERVPPTDVLLRIAGIFGVSIEDLIGEAG